MVFPRSVVKLNMHGHESLIGSPNVAVFYNHATVYERERLADEVDQCEFFQFRPTLLYDILAQYDPKARERRGRPFTFTHTFLSRQNFLLERQLLQLMFQSNLADVLQVDETAVILLENVMADSFGQRGVHPVRKTSTKKAHRYLAYETQKLFATRFNEQLTLQRIAEQLYVSPYHLSRVFREQVGCTLHHFLEQMRLRVAHERIGDYSNNLIQLALDVGYTTHSHFTDAFRRNFGYPPSQFMK